MGGEGEQVGITILFVCLDVSDLSTIGTLAGSSCRDLIGSRRPGVAGAGFLM